MIVSLHFWGVVQRAKRCHGCLSCSQHRPLQTWLILCSAVNRTICLRAASELIPAKHHFLRDGEETFLTGCKRPSQQINRVSALARLARVDVEGFDEREGGGGFHRQWIFSPVPLRCPALDVGFELRVSVTNVTLSLTNNETSWVKRTTTIRLQRCSG